MNKSVRLSLSLAILLLLIHSTLANNCTVQDCTTCETANTCSVCAGSLKPNIDKSECVLCDVDNCKICQSDSSCSICEDGYSKAQNSTSTTNGTTTNLCFLCDIDMCESCLSDNECGTCAQGYTLIQNSCSLCVYPCATCTADLTCQTCMTPDFFVSPDAEGKCFAHKVPFCLKYDLPNFPNCLTCQSNYVLNTTSNTCDRGCVYPCKQCSIDACSACEVGYYFESSNKTCLPCGFGCQVCTSSTVCLFALPGFYITGSTVGACLPFCGTCNSGLTSQCAEGCLRCSPLNINTCLQAKPGYILAIDGNLGKCAQKCKTCSATNTTKCLSCYKNTFLVNGDCVPCDSKCLTCESGLALSTCTSCRQGSFLSGTTCIEGCPQNCLSCSDGKTCSKCSSGFTTLEDTDAGTTYCTPCVGSCRICAQGTPDVCHECGDGSFLKDGTCNSCSSFCKKCTKTGCNQCYSGFRLGSDKTCLQNCKQPCATCEDNPFNCLSCMLGYSFDNTTKRCIPQSTCVGGCSACPFGYSLIGGQCKICTGNGCRTCLSNALNNCTSCVGGYFFDSANSACKVCPSSCTTCVSSSVCTSCASGYTSTATSLVGAGFTCLKCSAECGSCYGQTFKCTTCAKNYEFSGWKCVKKHRFVFGCRLGCTLGFFRFNLFRFIASLMFGFGRVGAKTISFNHIRQGSVVIEGSIDPSSDPGTASFNSQFSSLSNVLTQGSNIGGMPVQSSSTSLSAATPVSSNDSLGLILGICIPVGILILVLAAVGLVVYKVNSKNKQYSDQGQKDDKTGAQSSQGLGSTVKYDL